MTYLTISPYVFGWPISSNIFNICFVLKKIFEIEKFYKSIKINTTSVTYLTFYLSCSRVLKFAARGDCIPAP